MGPQLGMMLNGINQIMAKISESNYNSSDIANIRIYIDGYNNRVKWLGSKPNPEIYSEIKYQDYKLYYSQNAVYIKFN